MTRDGDKRAVLLQLFRKAVAAADPMDLLPARLPKRPRGRTVVVGAGKAAARMARAVEVNWDGPLSGAVVTPYGHGERCEIVEVIEAAHPVPDEAGQRAATRICALVGGLTKDDLVVCLLSGGGSSLLTLPVRGIALEDEQAATAALLRSGAPIAEINCVRKHLSAIKGGRLGALCSPARLVTFAISDVPDDDPSVIASGPTVADPTTFAEALAALERRRLEVPRAVLEHLRSGAAGGPSAPSETPKPGDGRIREAEFVILATSGHALRAAAEAAHGLGINGIVLGSDVQGEAREVAGHHAALASVLARFEVGWHLPCLLLSGGETTVTVRGAGRGGRNSEYLLALAIAAQGNPRIWGLAADTDGIDGSESNAGAFFAPSTLHRIARLRLDPRAFLDDNDSYSVFHRLGDLVVTGPTRTNVNDFRAILVGV